MQLQPRMSKDWMVLEKAWDIIKTQVAAGVEFGGSQKNRELIERSISLSEDFCNRQDEYLSSPRDE